MDISDWKFWRIVAALWLSLTLVVGCGSAQNSGGDATGVSDLLIAVDAAPLPDGDLLPSGDEDVTTSDGSDALGATDLDRPVDGDLIDSSVEDANADGDLTVSAMTFNIRYGVANDGDNAWTLRKDLVFQMIATHGGDFLGMQEAWKFQIDEITAAVPAYSCIGRSRTADGVLSEWSPVCYRGVRWQLDATYNGTFWLSETPDVPGSQSWSSSLPRIVTWGRFVEKSSGRGVYVFNTHFDHQSQEARLQSAKLLAQRIANRPHQSEPVILTGDFNAGESNPAITYLLGQPDTGVTSPVVFVDSFRVLYPNAADVGTFHGFSGEQSGEKIDYVFALAVPQTTVLSAEIRHDNDSGRYPSDHFPVTATLRFAEPEK